ncbi:hypothetical protein HN51_009649 [Arachis hypogaea]|uniref:protein unc-13 homolog n=1 Tax=Arachis hypogaea TaxID=3818 RepID=UPI000DEC14A5|nr:protein unc-13 homolog [Arachis hypogaea]QHO44168.1 uncharacterized protein DS421_5g168920 [Arachis hypogaea]
MASSHRPRRHDSSPGPFPPLSSTPPSSSAIPIPTPTPTHSRHESSPFPLLPPSSISADPLPPTSPRSRRRHSRRESLPGLSLPPIIRPISTHNRRDSCPDPFPLSPTSRAETPSSFTTSNNATTPTRSQQSQQLVRYESDPVLMPPSSPLESPQPLSPSSYFYDEQHNYVAKAKQDLYDKQSDLAWPFGDLQGIDGDDFRETAYELFFTACRSSPGFGGQSSLTFYSKHENNNGVGGGAGGAPVSQSSRVKRALGLKMMRSTLDQRISAAESPAMSPLMSPLVSPVAGGSSPKSRLVKPRKQMSMADVMRVQMQVTEQSDNRLRKTLMRTLVGQLGRQAETIILPLELLRHLKPSEFNNFQEYHLWQKRQLKMIEAGLLLYPSIPVEKTNQFAMNLREIIKNGVEQPLDTGRNSDTMRTFSNSVLSLSMRNPDGGAPTNVCHWANGYPVNVHLYIPLLQSIFDLKEETSILDEVDEMLDLMKKTWTSLGINRSIHNVCFAWVLFQKYVETGQVEHDLLCASHAMLNEVASDAKKEKDPKYVEILKSVLSSLKDWGEKRLLAYQEYFQVEAAGEIENLLPVVLLAHKILGDVAPSGEGSEGKGGDRVDDYIRSSMKNAFENALQAANAKYTECQTKKEISEVMFQLAQEIEDLANKERQSYSPVLKKWHPTAAAVAALTLNNCYGFVLKQYLTEMMTTETSETIIVLQRAKKLEDILVQMVVEDSVDCEDGGKTVVTEMVPFEVDSTIVNILKRWMDASMQRGNYCFQKAKEHENWNPKSKSEPYAKSVVELMNLAKIIVQEFFLLPVPITEDLVQELATGLQNLFKEYTMFVAACGLKENYVPNLPPLTRCNRNSKFHKFWKIATPCRVTCEDPHMYGIYEARHPHACTSRGTQRLYIRINTLHYLLQHIPSLDKSLSLSKGVVPSIRHSFKNIQTPLTNSSKSTSYFETANSSILAACQHLSEVASYRLIFFDSNSFLYETLYAGDVASARIQPGLTVLKHNLKLMTAILTERARAQAMKEIMKACFDAFLMVLLAGGTSRMFNESDYIMIQEDFENLKAVFINCGEGLVGDEAVEKESEVVEGVIALMGLSTGELMETLTNIVLSDEANGVIGHKLPMPPTTRKWSRTDPNTILRVLCYRNDKTANHYLKRTFSIAKRR